MDPEALIGSERVQGSVYATDNEDRFDRYVGRSGGRVECLCPVAARGAFT